MLSLSHIHYSRIPVYICYIIAFTTLLILLNIQFILHTQYLYYVTNLYAIFIDYFYKKNKLILWISCLFYAKNKKANQMLIQKNITRIKLRLKTTMV